MKMTDLFNRDTYKTSFFLLACLFFLGDIWLWGEISNVKDDLEQDEMRIEKIEAWKRTGKEKNHSAFLKSLADGREKPDVESVFKGAGCTVTESREESREKAGEAGTLFHIKGTGTFSQILTAFDIIENKEKGMVTERCHIKKEQGGLIFEAAVRHRTSRGAYEKKKYRSHRADGNGEEQSRENSR